MALQFLILSCFRVVIDLVNQAKAKGPMDEGASKCGLNVVTTKRLTLCLINFIEVVRSTRAPLH